MAASRSAILLAAACLSALAPGARAAEVTPIQKVISMLTDALAKCKSEKHSEQVEFAKFAQWCDSLRAEKEEEIADAKAKILDLTADITKAEADADALAGEIADLAAEMTQLQADIDSATAVREKENADYQAAHADFSESIDAIARAKAVLLSRTADVPQSLLQLRSSPLIPARAKAAVESFLALSTSEAEDAPEANAYEFQSQSVITMLEKLSKKFKDQLLALEKEEISARSNYETLMQQLTDNMRRDKKMTAEKTAAKAGRLEDAANAKADLGITENGKAEDEKTLSDTNAECESKSEAYEKDQVTRAAEVKAIEQAVEILSSGAVTGNAEKHLPTLVQSNAAPASFAQLRSSTREDPELRQRVAGFLQDRAKQLGSRYLSLVAARATEDPFGKVKKMIKDLIVKLMEEANSEADKKGFCDVELATNKQTRDIKTAECDELTAAIEKATAESAQLATEIADLSDAIAAIHASQAEATNLRNEQKAKNAEVVADAKEGQAAVEAATKVLKDFYTSAADASLLQGGSAAAATETQAEMKAAAKAPYKGMQDTSTGIFGMLEVILSDFARLEAETSAAEDAAQTAYDKFMAESTEDAAVKDTEMKHKVSKKAMTDEKNRDLKKELELTQEELAAAMAYYEKLKPDCVDLGLSYEERVRAREEEIASLQEALKILAGEGLA